MYMGISYACKCRFRSLKTELLGNTFWDEDIQKLSCSVPSLDRQKLENFWKR